MKIPYLCLGKITEIEENSTRKRVKVFIEGIAEPTGWITPLSTFSYKPTKDDSVGILFLMGDVERGFYLPLPILNDSYSLGGDNEKAGYETDNFKIEIIEKLEDEQVNITAKKSGTKLKILPNGVIEVDGKFVDIKGNIVNISGTEVFITNRLVIPNGKPIY